MTLHPQQHPREERTQKCSDPAAQGEQQNPPCRPQRLKRTEWCCAASTLELRGQVEPGAVPTTAPVPAQGVWPEEIKAVSLGSQGQKALKSNYATGTICCPAPSPPRARRAVLFSGRISSRGIPRQFSCCRQDSFSLGSLQAKLSGRSLNVQRRTDLKEEERASYLRVTQQAAQRCSPPPAPPWWPGNTYKHLPMPVPHRHWAQQELGICSASLVLAHVTVPI